MMNDEMNEQSAASFDLRSVSGLRQAVRALSAWQPYSVFIIHHSELL
jgi:hypothetical protein